MNPITPPAFSVGSTSRAVDVMRADWDLAEALLGGTRAMREAGELYLPKWPKEDEEAYLTRLSVSVLFPGYRRTIQTLAAKPFSQPVTFSEDMSPKIRGWCDSIDQQNRNVHVFGSEAMEVALGYGLTGILVDYPQRPAGLPNTQAAEAAAALRPYWVLIRPQQILGWRAERADDNTWRLTMLRFLEEVEEDSGDWSTTVNHQVRVLRPGSFEVHRKNEAGEWYLHTPPTPTTIGYIPFAPIYGEQIGFMLAKPPLIEVAHLNVAHWQSSSDQQNILHVARVPILVASGIEDSQWKLVIGASSAVRLPNSDASLKFVEHGGQALDAGAKELEALEERMRQAGAELLVLRYGRITATQVNVENAMGMCVLQKIAQGVQDALNRALEITADWVKDPNPGTVTLFNDFAATSLAEASAQLVIQMNENGKLSNQTMFTEMQRRSVLSPDHKWSDEEALITSQANLAPPVASSNADTPPIVQPTGAAAPAPPQQIDLSALADSIVTGLSTALAGLVPQAPTINIAPPAVTVNVPEQPAPNVTVQAPVVNVAPPAITVDAPVVNISPPDVTVTPAPITVNTPPVNVIVERGTGKAKLVEDTSGKITGIELQ